MTKKKFDQETLKKATQLAQTLSQEQALQNIPKTAAGFEKDFMALKRTPEKLLTYLQ